MRRRILTIGASVFMLVGGVLLVVAALAGLGSKKEPEPIAPRNVGPPIQAIRPSPIPEATPTPEPPPPSSAPVARLVIPKIKVDAPVKTYGLDADLSMPAPTSPTEVAWYDFSKIAPPYSGPPIYLPGDRSFFPGFGGNAVFAGHVDYHNYGPAVFWRLGELNQGDEIDVRLEDGTNYRYLVVTVQTFSADSAPVGDITGRTDHEVITIITCDSTSSFNPSTREYAGRVVVRADRMPDSSAVAR
jgi:LPXTG-site transpeptidase (sortase) family protein